MSGGASIWPVGVVVEMGSECGSGRLFFPSVPLFPNGLVGRSVGSGRWVGRSIALGTVADTAQKTRKKWREGGRRKRRRRRGSSFSLFLRGGGEQGSMPFHQSLNKRHKIPFCS